MKQEELQKRLETENVEFHGNCHDCNMPVKLICCVTKNGEMVITGGAMYNPKIGFATETFFKCDACFQQDKILRNYMPCEVFSRVVGYLRPVKQWNKGKQEEFEHRKEFIIDNDEVR